MDRKCNYLVVGKNWKSLEIISDFIQKKCLSSKLSFKKSWEILLAIDEICSSIVSCSIDEGNIIKIMWKENEKNEINIEIIEDGSPFNPLNPPENLYEINLNLLYESVDKIDYKRQNGCNKVIITKFKRKKRNKNGHS